MPPVLRTSLPPLGPDILVSVTDFVTRSIRDAILNGTMAPGERLQQDRLAEELRVSRQPVREALRRLEAEGLVVQSPQRWMTVQTVNSDTLRENYRLRALLESEAARVAAHTIGPTELDRLRDMTRALTHAVFGREADAGIISLNYEFHHLVWDSARMPTLLRLLEHLWVGRTIFTPLFIPGRAQRSAEEHGRVVDALERHDPAAAGDCMTAHITHAAKEYFSNLDERKAAHPC